MEILQYVGNKRKEMCLSWLFWIILLHVDPTQSVHLLSLWNQTTFMFAQSYKYYIFDIVWIFMTINVFSCVELYTLASPTVAAAVDILWCCNIQRHHERFSEATCSQGIGRLYQFVRRYPVTGSLSSSNCDRWRLCLQLSLFLPGLNLEAIYPPKIKKGK